MDLKVADLRKQLNKLKYQTANKTDKIARLMKDYEKIVNMNAESVRFLSILDLHISVHIYVNLISRIKQRKSWKTLPKAKGSDF